MNGEAGGASSRDTEKALLKKEKYEVVAASTGEEGMDMILQPDIHLILLDIILPKFDGFEILKKVRETEHLKKIPVIVFSNEKTIYAYRL